MRTTRPETPTHWLKQNHRNWSPRHVCFFDTETRTVPGTEPEVNELVLWYGRSVLRDRDDPTKREWKDAAGQTGAELVAWVEVLAKRHDTTWLYAHNLAFDMMTTNLLMHMIKAGWEVTDFSMNDRAPHFRFKRRSKRLLVTDSFSWLPVALQTVAESLDMTKPPLPEDPDDYRGMVERCKGDVHILSTAILDLMDWWDRNRLGNWSITGASCGWSAMRHKMRPNSFLIKPEPEGLEHDRLAIRGGRRGAWRLGSLRTGSYVEVDFKAAHPTLAAYLPMPRQRGKWRDVGQLDERHILTPAWGAIARCVVDTPEPRYPVTIGGQVFYPVGRFETVLAGPELQMAVQREELITLLDGRIHWLGTGMQPWAHWVLRVQDGLEADSPPVARIAAKSWGRSVIGKWSARTNEVIATREHWCPDYDCITGWDFERGCKASWVTINGTEWQVAQDQWSESAYPAVLAWIESHLRVRMATVIDHLPADCLVTCNTDGFIIDGERLRLDHARSTRRSAKQVSVRTAVEHLCDRLSVHTWPLELRVKHVFSDVNVLGPSAMELDNQRRWSGVRHDAVKVGEYTFESRLWPKLAWQFAQQDQRGYLRPMRTVHAPGPYVHDWICADGSLRPPEARLGANGATELVPWRESEAFSGGMIPALYQHPVLAGLL